MSTDNRSPLGSLFAGSQRARQPGDPLRSLEEHNAERKRAWEERNKPKPTGYACPKCGKEVYEPAQNLYGHQAAIYRDGPPSHEVVCGDMGCGWKGRLYS